MMVALASLFAGSLAFLEQFDRAVLEVWEPFLDDAEPVR
jgi:hypothetical protein